LLLKECRALVDCRLKGTDRRFTFVFVVVLMMNDDATRENVRSAWERRFGSTWQLYRLITWEET
jgi:hypothetical protein